MKELPIHLRIFRWLAAALLIAGGVLQAGVEYPAGGNLDPEEGTIEIWLTPMPKDLRPPDDGKYHSVFSLFSTKVPGYWNMSSGWYRHNSQLGLKVSMRSQRMPDGISALLAEAPPWERGHPQHFAFVWKGAEMAIYADGKKISDKRQGTGFDGGTAGAKLFFGGDDNNGTPIILHAIRVSSVARSESALTGAKPEADAGTLLLERFDKPDVATSTITAPEVIFSLGEKQSGKINGPVHFVTEPLPGLALYRESK